MDARLEKAENRRSPRNGTSSTSATPMGWRRSL